MNEPPTMGMAVLAGLVLAAAAAAWWLGGARLALDHGRDVADSAASTLQALLLVRGLALAVQSTRAGALGAWRPAVGAGLGWIAPSWPLVIIAWSASTTPFSRIVLAEGLLVGGSIALPLVGHAVRRGFRSAELAVMIATVAGIALGAAWLVLASGILD